MRELRSRRWPAEFRRGVVLAVLAYALAVAAFSSTRHIVGGALVFFGAGVLVRMSCGRPPAVERKSSFLHAADVVASNVALTLVLLEVALSIYGAVSQNALLERDNVSAYRFLPNHNYGRLWTNSYGYPSREFLRERRTGITRVVLLGDSFAVGSVRQDVNFASALERLRPKLEIYNFGVSAIGPRDYRVILETEAMAFDPDIVLVALFVGNDLPDTPVQAGLALDNHALGRFSQRSWQLLKESYRLRLAPRPPPLTLRQLSTPASPEKGFTLSHERYVEVELERFAMSRLSLRAANETSWKNALSELRLMRDQSRRRGVTFAVAIIPDEFQVNPDLREELLTIGSIPREDVDVGLPQRYLLDFCRREDIPCLDLLPILEGRRDAYLPQDTHWNETGNLLAAKALAVWLDRLRHTGGGSGELGLVDDRPPLMTR
jgi:hypothetical protein